MDRRRAGTVRRCRCSPTTAPVARSQAAGEAAAADEHLKASGLTYAILRSVALTNDGRGAEVILGHDVDKTANASRADVAHVSAEAATTGRFDGMAQDMQSA